MSTSLNRSKAKKTEPKSARGFVPTTALAKSVRFEAGMMHVHLTDGRIVAVPLVWFPKLKRAKPEQLREVEIGGGGIGLHWPELDEDIGVANLLAGGDRRST